MSEIGNYMRLALECSVHSIGVSRPNPAVGAVVVKDGIVVGKGRTQRPGSAHAEVMALRDAGELARGAAIYVTLEPCCHYGRTPPCTKAIIDAGIAEVYYAHGDPNPVVRGNSRAVLEAAGIKVYEGVDACIRAEFDDLSSELSGDSSGFQCRCLDDSEGCRTVSEIEAAGREVFHDIERYFEAYDYFVCNKRTFVEVKCAITDEGSMGYVLPNGSNKPMKITGEGANCWNHELRAISDAILVGAGTVLADNPSLNVRNAAGNDPVKIVWAGHHEFSKAEIATLKVFGLCRSERSASRGVEGSSDPVKQTLVFSCIPQPAIESSDCAEIVLLSVGTFAENWALMVDELSARGMHRLMVEPGAGLAKQLFENGGWNRLDLWRSTDHTIEDALASFIDEGSVAKTLDFPAIPEKLIAKESFMVGPDVLTVFYPA
ncbi:MAG: dihydrofolate reductase family protein [Fibrobacter sp.]|nr:dihydrofolate reductase family protein [Fibrobacter sp.]